MQNYYTQNVINSQPQFVYGLQSRTVVNLLDENNA
nr:MAG TPA_asm: hypothetical protein [Caudoviricetes sp.]